MKGAHDVHHKNPVDTADRHARVHGDRDAVYEQRGPAVTNARAQRQAAKMIRELRRLGYRIEHGLALRTVRHDRGRLSTQVFKLTTGSHRSRAGSGCAAAILDLRVALFLPS
jgi:hypothetical protein